MIITIIATHHHGLLIKKPGSNTTALLIVKPDMITLVRERVWTALLIKKSGFNHFIN